MESKAKNLVLEMSHDYSSIAFVGLSYKKGSWLLEDSHPFSVFKSIIAENERVIERVSFAMILLRRISRIMHANGVHSQINM